MGNNCFRSNSVSWHGSSDHQGIAGRSVSVSKVTNQKGDTQAMEEGTHIVQGRVLPSRRKEDVKPAGLTRPKKSLHVDKPSSAGIIVDSVLRTETLNSVFWHRSSDKMDGHRGIAGRSMSVSEVAKQKGDTQAMEEGTHIVQSKVLPSRQKEDVKPAGPTRPKKSLHVKKPSSAGLTVDSILRTKTSFLKEYYNLGRNLGSGQFGSTFLCVEKATGTEYACKSIAKRKMLTMHHVEDVRREIEIMHHLAGHPNVISIKEAHEDSAAVHLVMELCAGGDLFDRIEKRGHYAERKAAQLARTIVGVVEACHSLRVMHRDLKPENFLFVNEQEDSPLKMIDFGLSTFFKPGETFTVVAGSPNYIAPEVLQNSYGPEADVWSAGAIIYILLSGFPPFWGKTKEEIFEEVLHGDLDFSSYPWPNISESAKDLVRRMLVRNPTKRITAHEVLCHPWLQVDRDGRIGCNELMAMMQKGNADQRVCRVGVENGGGEDNGIPSPGWKGRKWIGTSSEESI